MGAIKNAMKKILPPPVSAFNREVERLLEAQEKSTQLVARMSRQLEEQKRQIARLEAQVEKCTAMSASIQREQAKTWAKVERVRKTVSQVHGSVEDYDYYANLSPEAYRSELQEWFFDMTGRKLDLDNPKTYNEKIQWLKLYDSTPLKTRLADKYLVRDWVKEKIGEEYLVPLLGVWDSFDEIDFDTLPQSFVLKANHGCGWNLVVKDKSLLDVEDARRKFQTWMKLNFAFRNGLELHYMNIRPRIIAEAYLENDHDDLHDYKVFCFAGKALHVMHVTDRSVGRKMTFYDTQWQMQTFAHGSFIGHEAAPRPQRLEELVEVAEKLAQGFAHVRVDFYVLNDGTLKFGELTFTPASGICQWNPPQLYGDLIQLPEKSPIPVLER